MRRRAARCSSGSDPDIDPADADQGLGARPAPDRRDRQGAARQKCAVIVMDEPTSASRRSEVERLFAIIERLRSAASRSSISPTGSTRCSASPTASPCCATAACRHSSIIADVDDGSRDRAMMVGRDARPRRAQSRQRAAEVMPSPREALTRGAARARRQLRPARRRDPGHRRAGRRGPHRARARSSRASTGRLPARSPSSGDCALPRHRA